ncbi:MAG: ATP-grasp domain-containing protein [Clostridia bacterium]|nr:ATP-grasp domain-containing protein [Clostridia bacterium]
MEDKNILILSAGRRVELIKCFKDAAKKLGITSKIVAADLMNNAPALYFADKKYQIPRIGTDNYIDSIIEICNEENIHLIVPTIDTELLILSQEKQKIEESTQAKVLVSDESVIKICRDKINTQRFFEENGFGVPVQIKEEDIKNENVEFPVFIKPLNGSSSINTFKVNNIDELKFFYNYVKEPIVQEFMEGEEYTVDCFLDFNSNIITIVPRKRIATRSGEIIKGKILKDQEIINDIRKVLEVLKPIGQITIQCMKTKEGIKYIEINPRFGGGAPMSIKAGANSCKNLYKLLNGEKLDFNEDYRENISFFRFDDAIMVDENMELIND